jgi:Fe-Mn family superoxide dismutase
LAILPGADATHLAFKRGPFFMGRMDTEPTQITRRDALKTLGASATLLGLNLFASKLSAAPSSADVGKPGVDVYPFALPPLGYAFNALEPHIDARTMEIHYTKHHQAYIDNANKALASRRALQNMAPEYLLAKLDTVPEPLRTTLCNNVGGHANHAFFWEIIAPAKSSAPARSEEGELVVNDPGMDPKPLLDAIAKTFGSLDAFKKQFSDAAAKVFGSGWAWLVASRATGKLVITTSGNQDSPLLTNNIPLLGLDVWEHAYYLKYQNRRADYITAFWEIINWRRCGMFYSRTPGAPFLGVSHFAPK